MNTQDFTNAVNKGLNAFINFFKNFPENMKKLWEKIKALPNDEKYSWGAITLGSILIIVAIIIW